MVTTIFFSQVPPGSMTLFCRTSLGSHFLMGCREMNPLKTQTQRDPRHHGKGEHSESPASLINMGRRWEGNHRTIWISKLSKGNKRGGRVSWVWGRAQGTGEVKGQWLGPDNRFVSSTSFSHLSAWGRGGWLYHWPCCSKPAIEILDEGVLILQLLFPCRHIHGCVNLHLGDRALVYDGEGEDQHLTLQFPFQLLLHVGHLDFDGHWTLISE